MRKIAVLAAFVAMAGATAVQAQGNPPTPPGGMRGGMRGRGGPGGPGAMMDQMLLKGITLTDAQKASLEQLRKSEREQMQAHADEARAEMEAIRDARQKGDTVTANRLMAEQRAKMDARRDDQFAAIRAILTGDQVTQFDANVAEMKKRQSEMGGMGRGRRGGRPPAK